ncbi:Alpha/Beta hydrolase protein, partial [Vararia minispora EC-137]
LIIPPRSGHRATFVFLHGLGSSGLDWKPYAEKFSEPSFDHIKWILPNAPLRPITSPPPALGPRGAILPAWFCCRYDVYAFGQPRDQRQDIEGHLASTRTLQSIIDAEMVANPDIPIVLGGHSQGSAMTVLTGLTYPGKLAGLVCLSGRIPLSPYSTSLPIFIAHGRADNIVLFENAYDGFEFLKSELGVRESQEVGSSGITFHGYEGVGHEGDRCLQEMTNLKEWLEAVI